MQVNTQLKGVLTLWGREHRLRVSVWSGSLVSSFSLYSMKGFDVTHTNETLRESVESQLSDDLTRGEHEHFI